MLILIYLILAAIGIAPFVVAIVNYRSSGDLVDAVDCFFFTILNIAIVCIFLGSLGAIALSAWEYF